MENNYCDSCKRNTGFARSLGWGTLFGALFTAGISLLIIPFYPKRCVVCGALFNNGGSNTILDIDTKNQENSDEKKCPLCAEIIKLEALKCKHCGEMFDPEEVKKQIFERQQQIRDLKTIKHGMVYCAACRKESPVMGMFYNKATGKYYHPNCLPKW